MAVARLLGRDAGRLVNADTRRIVLAILNTELLTDGNLRLLSDMLTGSSERAELVLELLGSFRQGVLDSSAGSANVQASNGTTSV